MGTEIERKFRVDPARLPALPPGEELEQGYLSDQPTVRVRRVQGPGGARGELTIKGPGLVRRAEFNYPIPAADAAGLLDLCARALHKTRWRVGRWDLDRFPDAVDPRTGARGFWLAEIELTSEDEPFERPEWLLEEVSGDPAYSNARLATLRGAG